MKMNSVDFAAAVLVGLLAFRQNYDKNRETEEASNALKRVDGEESESAANGELDEEDWVENFTDYLRSQSLATLSEKVRSNDKCIAALKHGEPAFTLRGQDVLASVMVRHWAAVAGLNDDCPESKIDHAEQIAEKMEEYSPQKWPD